MCREDHTWAVFSPQKLMNSVSVFTANLCGKVASHGKSLWQSPHATCSAQSGRQIEIVVLRQWLRRTSLFANVRQTLVANAAHHCGKAQKGPHLSTCGRGQRHGITPFCLSARPVCTHLALHYIAPQPTQVLSAGSRHANCGARAPQAQTPPLQRASNLRGADAQASLRLL